MRLLDLEPQFLHVDVAEPGKLYKVGSLAEANGIRFQCPKCLAEKNSHGVHSVVCLTPAVPPEFGLGPGRWPMQGTGYEDLTLTPSVWLNQSHCGNCTCKLGEYCGWHGFITNGQVSIL